MKYIFKLGIFINIQKGTIDEVRQECQLVDQMQGIDHIEIWREAEKIDNNAQKLIEDLAQKYEIILHAPFINVSGASGHSAINEASVSVLQDYYNWGVDLGAQVFTIHGGHKPFYQSVEEDVESIGNTFAKLRIQDTLKPTLEHMPIGKHFTTAPNSLVSLEALTNAKNLLPEFGYTLDIGHVWQNKEEWKEWFREHKPEIYDIHLHDAFLGGKAHLPLGTADLDCRELFEFLDTEGYNKYVSLEVVGKQEMIQSWEYLNEKGLV